MTQPAHLARTEEALIGALLNSPSRYFDLRDTLDPQSIRTPVLRSIYQAIGSVAAETSAVSLHMVADRISTPPDGLDALTFLASLADAADGSEPMDLMAAEIAEAAARAAQSAALADLQKAALAGTMTSEEMAALVVQRITDTVPRSRTRNRGSLGQIVRDRAMWLASYDPETGERGITTGLRDLDKIMGQMLPGELIILAGRPGFGKTALAMQIVGRVAMQQRVSIFQMEMSASAVADRILTSRTGISAVQFRRREFSDLERTILVEQGEKAAAKIGSHVEIDTSAGITVAQMRAALLARRSREGEIAMVVVDHSKLWRIGGKIDQDEIARIAEGYRLLKDVAKELPAVVVVLSQFKTSALQRDLVAKTINQLRPRAEDLYGGSAPREFADAVLLGHRPEDPWKKLEPPRTKQDEHAEWSREMGLWTGKAEIIIDKFRGGEGGQSVEVKFNGGKTRFEDLPKPEPEEVMWP